MQRIINFYNNEPEFAKPLFATLLLVIVMMTGIGIFTTPAVFLGALTGMGFVWIVSGIGIALYARHLNSH